MTLTQEKTFSELMEAHKETMRRINTGQITADEVREKFAEMKEAKPIIEAELNRRTIKQLTGGGNPRGYKKGEIVRSIVERVLQSYIPGDCFSWSPFEETAEAAVDRHLKELTDETITEHARKLAARKAETEKCQKNPETLYEFARFFDKQGIEALSDEQLSRYDTLIADQALKQAEREAEERAIVRQVEIGETSMTLIETKHTKKLIPLFVVQLSDRVSRETYEELNISAKRLGGYYSSYRGGGAVPGFTFEDKAQAEKFMNIGEEDQSRADLAEERQAETTGNAVERLRDMAARMEASAEESLNAPRQVNTCRRARMAEGAEASARSQIRLAQTIRNLADSIEGGTTKYLGGIRTRAQVETLFSLCSRAKWEHLRQSKYSEEQSRRDPTVEDVRFAEYPFPQVSTSELLHLTEIGLSTSGVKRVSAKLRKVASRGEEWIKVESEYMAEDIKFLCRRLRSDRNAQNIADRCTHYTRIQNAGIKTLPHLRAVLREFLTYRGDRVEVDPIVKLERELIGLPIADFFPTPPAALDAMLCRADLCEGLSVLEPSAGKGDIADEARAQGAAVQCVEINGTLRAILKAKNHTLIHGFGDFLDLPANPVFDRVLMNPPFSNLADIDHVRHAYGFLKDGGRLVAIMSAAPFYRGDRKAEEFRQWLEEVGAEHEELPDDSFNGADAFRKTGVNTRIVTISKN